jgi:hypothetical protein
MGERIGQEEKHPPCEDQIVVIAGKRSIEKGGLPDAALTQPIALRERFEPPREGGRSLDGVDRSMHAAPERHVQRSLAGPDFKHPPPGADTDPLEERQRDRIPEARLRAKPSSLARSIAQQITIAAHGDFTTWCPALAGRGESA